MATASPWTIVAEAGPGARFASFAPYVPAVTDEGAVYFQAALPSGRHALVVADPEPRILFEAPALISHPAVDADGVVSIFAPGELLQLAPTGAGPLRVPIAVGPLGPTASRSGDVAFRATTPAGADGIYVLARRASRPALVADTTSSFSAFEGLPVAAADGSVVFRADRRAGGQGIYRAFPGAAPTPIVETSEALTALGRFPSLRDDGAVNYVATLSSGSSAVFAGDQRIATPPLALRGVLSPTPSLLLLVSMPLALSRLPMDRQGHVLVRARCVPVGLPVPIPVPDPDFALNPVSVSPRGHVALRTSTAILRANLLDSP